MFDSQGRVSTFWLGSCAVQVTLWMTCWTQKTDVWPIIWPPKCPDWNLWVSGFLQISPLDECEDVEMCTSTVPNVYLPADSSVMWQLAFEIDREADDQNDYLDNMVRNELQSSVSLLLSADDDPLLSGLQLPECDRSADGQREAFLHHGAVWEGQPPYSVLRVHGAGPGLLPALLPDLQDTAVTSAPHICCTGRDFYFVKQRGSAQRKTHEEATGRTNLLQLADEAWTYELFVTAKLVHTSYYHTNISKVTVVLLTGGSV